MQKWRDDLVNLNRRNRLLYFKHTKTSSLEIASPSCDDVLAVLNSRPGRLEFYQPTVQPDRLFEQPRNVRPPAKNEAVCHVWKGTAADGGLREATGADLSKILRSLDRQARAEFMDRGLQSLYLGAGLLEWIDPKMPSEVNAAPLFLVPVELERSGPGEPYRLVRAQDDVVVNPALQLKLDNDFGLTLPSWDDDEGGCDEYFSRVRQAIRRQSDWTVREVAVLARFSFLKEVMYRDLLEHEDEICEHPLVRALASPAGSRSDFDFEPVDDEDLDRVAVDSTLLSIRDADATQRACIWAAREGRTFVMDGPPGTGKSQTIANMIAELIGNGRSVLFVSEKAAALEVVHSRLQECGLDEYVLQLHSHKATRREVAKQLSASVKKRPKMNGQLSDSEVSDLHKKRKQLSEYAIAMNEVREPLGMNLFEAIGRASGLNGVARPAVRAELDTELTAGQMASILSAANDLQRSWGPVERGASFVWRDLAIGRIDAARRAEITELLHKASDSNAAVDNVLREAREELSGWEPGLGVDGLARVGELLLAVSEAPDTDPLWLTHEVFGELERAGEELGQLKSDFEDRAAEVATTSGRDVDLDGILDIARKHRDVQALSREASWSPDPEWKLDRISAAAAKCAHLRDAVRNEMSELLDELVAATGSTGWDSASLSDARDLAELVGMAERPDRPEAAWLSLARLSELKHAQPVLASMVTAMREKRQRVNSVFSSPVMELDAEALHQRFSQVHQGFGRVSIGYLKDRKAIAAVCRTGKFSQAAVQLLPVVVELQKLSADLQAFERDQAALVGTYYRGEETDLERLERAIEIAESALSMVEQRMSLSNALGSVARQAEVDPGALLVARRLRTALDSFLASANELLIDVDGVSTLSLDDLVERLELTEAAARSWAGFAEMLGKELSVSVMTSCAQSADEAAVIVESEETVRPRLEALIGSSYLGLESDVAALRSRVASASKIRAALGTAIPTVVGERVLGHRLDAGRLFSAIERWRELESHLLALFEQGRADILRGELGGDCTVAARLVDSMSESLDDIDEWIAFVDSRRRLSDLGLGAVVAACVSQRIPQVDVAKVVERIVLETWIDATIESDGKRLSPLRARDRQALRSEFMDLDKRLLQAAAGRVMRSCNERRPSKSVGAVGIILREGEKKTRHMPIRTLLEKTKAESQAIKPCFMMSPLSVSQFLPSDMRFDVVLFDEASQIRPHDAINCIYRGSQHIIAGDQQQLPPTSFFDGVRDDGDDVWDEEELETFESVLDVAKSCASVPSLPLRWHYRSRHEDLITYSNVSFYESNLISFPAPHVAAPVLGVGFNKVEGVYRRGRGTPNDNPIEARAVAELVAGYAKRYPKLTLGVVAFSSAQEEAIENAIDQLRLEDPTLPDGYFDTERLDGFFVKNLETVQGDERDVIILSVGYGRDETGKILMNFGPINQAGGYRRLNVAVTRARMRLELVTSITAADISSASENDGVRHMKRYLDYAERGPSVLSVGDGRSLGGVESPFEAEVARVVRSWGYDVVTQVGSAGYRIDLALVHPDQPGRLCLAIECDGAAYHTSKVARDRDRLRDEVLQGLGWRIHRIWGTAWYRQRDLAEAELRAAIERAINECGFVAPVEGSRRMERLQPVVEVEQIEVDEDFDDETWIVDYKVELPALSRMDKSVPMGDRSACPIMQRSIPVIVSIESPVHKDVVLRRLKDAWGQQRAGKNVMAEFETALRYCVRSGSVQEDNDGFLWSSDERSLSVARRPSASEKRTLRTCSEVCGEEFDVAVSSILKSVTSIGEGQLARQAAAVFGWERVGADIRNRIQDSVKRVTGADESLVQRILPDEEIPRLQTNGRTPVAPIRSSGYSRSAAPSSSSNFRSSASTSRANRCAVCGSRFGDRSAPTEITYYEAQGPVKKTAHQTCVDAVSQRRKTVSGYRWETVRGGLVPAGRDTVPDNVRKLDLWSEPDAPQPRVVGWDSDSNTPIIE